MNKRKRTAHRRAALWGGVDPTDAIDLDARVAIGKYSEVVFACGVWHDDGGEIRHLFPDDSGYTVRQMTVEEAADEIDAIVAAEAERRGPITRSEG